MNRKIQPWINHTKTLSKPNREIPAIFNIFPPFSGIFPAEEAAFPARALFPRQEESEAWKKVICF